MGTLPVHRGSNDQFTRNWRRPQRGKGKRMHLVTIERRVAENLRGTLLTIEGWLAENGIERGRLHIQGGMRPGTVAFTVRFDCRLQADCFAGLFAPRPHGAIQTRRYPRLYDRVTRQAAQAHAPQGTRPTEHVLR
jgi:hypothetical protein